MKYLKTLAIPLGLAAGMIGCDAVSGLPGGDEDGIPTAVSIAPDADVVVAEGETAALTLNDQDGDPITEGVTWWTDDQQVATVNAVGVVQGLAMGETMVHARLGELEDSVAVTVQLGAADEGTMEMVLTGDIEFRQTITYGSESETGALQAEFLDHPEWTLSYVVGDYYNSATDEERGVIMYWPGAMAAGEVAVPDQTMDVGQFDDEPILGSDAAVALGFHENANGDDFLLIPAGGTITIEEVVTPAGDPWDGTATGSVVGRASFTVEEFASEEVYDSESDTYFMEYTPTGRTAAMHVTFNLPAGLYEGGYMDLTISGGPYGNGVQVEGWGEAWYDDWDGQLSIGMSLLTEAGDEMDFNAYVPAATGSHTVTTSNDAYWHHQTLEPRMHRDASGQSGTVVVSSYDAPTTSSYGYAEGTVDVTMVVDYGDNLGETFTVTGSYKIPVEPNDSGAEADRTERGPLSILRLRDEVRRHR